MSIQLQKDYNIQGRELTVEVGRATELDDGTIMAWEYRILVKGHLIEESVYRWDTTKRPLTNMNVANHLASYWGSTGSVIDAQQFPESDEVKLNKIVLACADKMHEHFKPPAEFKDYDIIQKHMDETSWDVVLHPNYRFSEYLISFHKCDGPVIVEVYRKAHDFTTEI